MNKRIPNIILYRKGFALVSAIAILVLLVVVAVGMLSLSTISIRTASSGQNTAEARANARLALMMAIGQLQRAAGPDQRITAPGNILRQDQSPALTGVWESIKLDPTSHPNLDQQKESEQTTSDPNGEFVSWLLSDAYVDREMGLRHPDLSPSPERATLLPSSLSADGNSVSAKIINIDRRGGLGWLTIDEGVKARLDLADREESTDALRRARLRAPELLATRHTIPELATFEGEPERAPKVVSFKQGELVASDPKAYAKRFHSLTTWSAGLATDTVNGGLKGDLTQAFERQSIPSSLRTRRVYSNTDTANLVAADPYFNSLRDHYRLYKKNYGPQSPIESYAPSPYSATTLVQGAGGTEQVPVLEPVNGSVVAPVVTRVNVSFSLIAREAHGHWRNTVPWYSGDPRRNNMVYLIYTPMVTLYNPYTVPITVNNLQVGFKQLPLAFQFFRNGKPQTNNPALLSQFHVSSQSRTDWEDEFRATLVGSGTGSSGSNGSTAITINPGEARLFGVNHPRGTLWSNMLNYLWQNNLDKSLTLNMQTREGWDFNSGFIVDWLAPQGAGRAPDNANLGVFGVRDTDEIDVEISLRAPTQNGRKVDSFTVDISAKLGNSQKATSLGAYRYRYGSIERLTEAIEDGRHPAMDKVVFPAGREKPWRYRQLYQPNVEALPIERWTGPKQFALFTLAARTAQDSLYPTKTGRDNSFVTRVLDMDITNTHPAQMPMELSFLPIRGEGIGTPGSFDVANAGAGDFRSYYFAGWNANTGLLNFPTYEIPRAPLLNIADLRHANLASSGHLPMPAYTVGESNAHPSIRHDRAMSELPGLNYRAADHSWLANNALWDSYYFSGLRNDEEAAAFFDTTESLINPRITPKLPAGVNPTSAVAAINAEEGWKLTAGYHYIKGAFNINSTSVDAWRTLLSALRGSDIPLLDPVNLIENAQPMSGAPLPRRLDGPAGSLRLPEADNLHRWNGIRDLDDDDIRGLAEHIVEQIQEHGPFLSLSEFINRRLDGKREQTALMGALARAIGESGLNDNSATLGSRDITKADATEIGYTYREAAVGETEEAATAFLSQGDLLSAIGATITPRSDTFVIRAYGESRDASGTLRARATCEAVVQRTPDYVSPENRFDHGSQHTDGDLSAINKFFGRRFEVVSLRWLSPEELAL